MDIITNIKKLEAAGFNRRQAEEQVQIMDSLSSNLATKDDFNRMLQIMVTKFDAIDTKFIGKLEAIDTKFIGKFEAIDTKFEALEIRFDAINIRLDAQDGRIDALPFRTAAYLTVLLSSLYIFITNWSKLVSLLNTP